MWISGFSFPRTRTESEVADVQTNLEWNGTSMFVSVYISLCVDKACCSCLPGYKVQTPLSRCCLMRKLHQQPEVCERKQERECVCVCAWVERLFIKQHPQHLGLYLLFQYFTFSNRKSHWEYAMILFPLANRQKCKLNTAWQRYRFITGWGYSFVYIQRFVLLTCSLCIPTTPQSTFPKVPTSGRDVQSFPSWYCLW